MSEDLCGKKSVRGEGYDYNNKSSPPLELKDPNAPAPAPAFAPPAGCFWPPHNPAIAFSLSKSFIDFPAPVFAIPLVGFAAPGPSDMDHRSSKLALAPAAGLVCVPGVTPGRAGDEVSEEGVAEGVFKAACPPKRF